MSLTSFSFRVPRKLSAQDIRARLLCDVLDVYTMARRCRTRGGSTTSGGRMPNKTPFSAALALVAMLGLGPAGAQDYPTPPITLEGPFPPGGSTTIVARTAAPKRRAALAQPIVA